MGWWGLGEVGSGPSGVGWSLEVGDQRVGGDGKGRGWEGGGGGEVGGVVRGGGWG